MCHLEAVTKSKRLRRAAPCGHTGASWLLVKVLAVLLKQDEGRRCAWITGAVVQHATVAAEEGAQADFAVFSVTRSFSVNGNSGRAVLCVVDHSRHPVREVTQHDRILTLGDAWHRRRNRDLDTIDSCDTVVVITKRTARLEQWVALFSERLASFSQVDQLIIQRHFGLERYAGFKTSIMLMRSAVPIKLAPVLAEPSLALEPAAITIEAPLNRISGKTGWPTDLAIDQISSEASGEAVAGEVPEDALHREVDAIQILERFKRNRESRRLVSERADNSMIRSGDVNFGRVGRFRHDGCHVCDVGIQRNCDWLAVVRRKESNHFRIKQGVMHGHRTENLVQEARGTK